MNVTVADLEMAVAKLPGEELSEFRRWFVQFDSDAWDREIEADAAAGRLDKLAEQAISDFHAGRCTAL